MNKPPLDRVFVTRPYLPPLDEFLPYLEQIWDSGILTNNGPMHQAFERALGEYLGVEHVSVACNGTIALLTALQALAEQGEVITTPYSFVATSHTLLWNRFRPVFVDVDDSFNIDPNQIEAAITSSTRLILAVHCYGNPCQVEAIEEIARRHGLKVIYDAAHAFAVRDAGGSILRHGDMSVLSFHATKVFNTFEGGGIVSRDAATKAHIDNLKNFGFEDETIVTNAGINGKMNEFSAALGLLQLKYVDKVIAQRRAVDRAYRERLEGVEGVRLLTLPPGVQWNFAYFPVRIEAAYPLSRDVVYQRLAAQGIHTRRYFYPLISNFPMYRELPSAHPGRLPVANRLADEVLCLPIYPDLPEAVIDAVAEMLKRPV